MVLPLSAPPLSLSHTQIGLFGLAGVAGALAAARAGRLADQGLGNRTTGIALALLTLSWLPTAFVESSLLAMVVGVVLLDFAVKLCACHTNFTIDRGMYGAAHINH